MTSLLTVYVISYSAVFYRSESDVLVTDSIRKNCTSYVGYMTY